MSPRCGRSCCSDLGQRLPAACLVAWGESGSLAPRGRLVRPVRFVTRFGVAQRPGRAQRRPAPAFSPSLWVCPWDASCAWSHSRTRPRARPPSCGTAASRPSPRVLSAQRPHVQMTLRCVNRPRLPFIVDMWVLCTLGLLQILLMTVCVQVFAWAYIFIPFGFMPRHEMGGLYSNLC